jgi:hypothetical protein
MDSIILGGRLRLGSTLRRGLVALKIGGHTGANTQSGPRPFSWGRVPLARAMTIRSRFLLGQQGCHDSQQQRAAPCQSRAESIDLMRMTPRIGRRPPPGVFRSPGR